MSKFSSSFKTKKAKERFNSAKKAKLEDAERRGSDRDLSVQDGEYEFSVTGRCGIGKEGGNWEGQPYVAFECILDDDRFPENQGEKQAILFNLNPENPNLDWQPGACCSLLKKLVPDAEDDIEEADDPSIIEEIIEEMNEEPPRVRFRLRTTQGQKGQFKNLDFRALLNGDE